MNDFTKEELINIEKALYKQLPCGEDASSLASKLILKLQSMIDNYCEHECIHEFKRREMNIDLCEKCKSFKFVFSYPNGKEINE